MRFNSVKRGNFSGLAKSVNRTMDQVFQSSRETSMDNTKIANEAIKGRSMERRAAMKAEAEVARAGLDAYTSVKMTKNEIETDKKVRDIKRPAKRMAGIVGGLGAITGGLLSMKEGEKAKAEQAELKAERDKVTQMQNDSYAKTKAQNEQMMEYIRGGMKGDPPGIESVEGASELLNPDKPESTPAPTASPETRAPTPSPSATAPTPSPAAITPTKPQSSNTSVAPSAGKVTAKSIAGMATAAGAKFPKLVAAQWALESAWGKTPSGKNNYFGIKAAGGEASTSKPTWEVINGKKVNTSANFKDFDTPQGSVNHLTNQWYKDYKNYKGVNRAASAQEAADLLVKKAMPQILTTQLNSRIL